MSWLVSLLPLVEHVYVGVSMYIRFFKFDSLICWELCPGFGTEFLRFAFPLLFFGLGRRGSGLAGELAVLGQCDVARAAVRMNLFGLPCRSIDE